jgi:hypothetical protein
VGLGDVGLTFLFVAALLVAWRRLAGALHTPAGAGLLLAVGTFAAVLAGGFRLAPRGTLRSPVWQRRFLAVAPAAVLIVLGVAIGSVSGIGGWGMAALWGPMLAEELWSVWRLRRGSGQTASPFLDSAIGMITASLVEPQADGEVTLQLVRSHASDGSETVSGWLRLAFAAGQRQATAHLAFCPPFAHAPELDVRQAEGPASRVKASQVLPYGARLEVKLASAADRPVAVRLQFTARAMASSGEAYVKPAAG